MFFFFLSLSEIYVENDEHDFERSVATVFVWCLSDFITAIGYHSDGIVWSARDIAAPRREIRVGGRWGRTTTMPFRRTVENARRTDSPLTVCTPVTVTPTGVVRLFLCFSTMFIRRFIKKKKKKTICSISVITIFFFYVLSTGQTLSCVCCTRPTLQYLTVLQ